MQRYLWQQAEGQRHAYDSHLINLKLGVVFPTLSFPRCAAPR